MNMNPFSYGKPITSSENFVGRQIEIHQISARLLTSALESTSLVGERRMGKTSLLQQLLQPGFAAKLGLTVGDYCLLYIDMGGIADKITPQRFWERVLKKMQTTIQNVAVIKALQNLLDLKSFDIFDLEDLFEVVSQEGLKVVLLLDEFESITQNPNFGADFFGGLRSLAISKPLGLVTATRSNLVELCHSDEIKSSPFFNIFATVILRPFNLEESLQLVENALARSPLSFDNVEKDLLLELGGRHPFFLQIAGYHLYEGKCMGLTGSELQKHLLSSFSQQVDPHFGYLWEACTENQKITLITLMVLGLKKEAPQKGVSLEQINKVHPRGVTELDTLKLRGLLMDKENGLAPFSPCLETWIRRELQALPGEEDDAQGLNEWIKRGGMQDAAEASTFLRKFKRKYWPLLSECAKQLSFGVAGNALYTLLTNNLFRSIL